MIKSKAVQMVAVALAAGVLIGAAADRAISRADVRGMSDAEKNRQVRKDLLSILLPSKSLYASNQLGLEGDVWLHTRASATAYKSLCQRDTLLLYYTAMDRVGPHADRLSRPYAITANRSYRFAAPPKPEYVTAAEDAEQARSPFSGECRKLDPASRDEEWTGWFKASSPEKAMEAGFAMLALESWLAHSTNQFENCRNDKDAAACRSNGDYVSLDTIGEVEDCIPDSPDRVCVQMGHYGSIYTIQAHKTGKPMQAADIISVNHEIMIIVT
ncbi:MAG: hypothetical protein ABL914_04470 [Novosphingobium sp.]|uniref:hypothetical protein n=1 Tax=Novosphingobium sp. TaxID=1874826 RepID=UPI0032BBBF04